MAAELPRAGLPSPSALLIGFAMAVVAGSVGMLGFLLVGLTAVEAVSVAVAFGVGLGLWRAVARLSALREEMRASVADVSRAYTDLARQTGEMQRRMSGLENAVEARVRAAAEPMARDVAEIGDILRELTDTVAEQQATLAHMMAQGLERAGGRAAEPAGAAGGAVAARPAAPEPVTPVLMDQLRRAVGAGRIELYLQPIVTLPQRKVRWYDAQAYIKVDGGEMLAPARWRPIAEAAGLVVAIERAALLRTVQVVRRLTSKKREVGVFASIAAQTLVDAGFNAEMNGQIAGDPTLNGQLVFSVAQAHFRGFGAIEAETLGALTDRGFRVCLDRVQDLRFEPRMLAERGVRYVRVGAELLLRRAVAAGAEIHPADLGGLFARYGIEVIVEDVESEATVADLLDYEVALAQGLVFGGARPVRADVLAAGVPDPARAEAARPEPARAPDPRAEALRVETLRAEALRTEAARLNAEAGGGGRGITIVRPAAPGAVSVQDEKRPRKMGDIAAIARAIRRG